MAVALVGLYGLRPSELRTLEIVDGTLRATSTKRNLADARRGKSARLLLPLDLKELPGEGERVLKLFASGKTKLPNQIINARDNKSAGHAFGQYLRRNAVWQTFLEENPELLHTDCATGYAWRGARYYDEPVVAEDLASLMGHEYPTHVSTTGSGRRTKTKLHPCSDRQETSIQRCDNPSSYTVMTVWAGS